MKLVQAENFTHEYRNKFIDFINTRTGTGNIDNHLIGWLIANSVKMQGLMGQIGIMRYTNQYQGVIYNRYEIILNEIPKLRNSYLDDFSVRAIDDALLRRLGVYKDDIDEYQSTLSNPLKWFSEGMNQIFALPLYFLQLIGLIGSATVSKIASNPIFKFLTKLGIAVGFIASVVTIIQGYDQTKKFASKFVPSLTDTIKTDTIKPKVASPKQESMTIITENKVNNARADITKKDSTKNSFKSDTIRK